ncbi:hypothetical protein HWQ46_00650 [Shewanella sp. D64]|uniref:sialate O-acetylesterase n=1 Tax=unclassified Shewanella TaxID=196818 RepID=UPI0022BA14A5|nr:MULTISPECIES: sialate O-acetylesterase [unclassified Shewanella]MEC4724059.1 hypothetical protein [Shewanella sp. D64]MEC4736079.1 hypothetical protein [Shewanella sp. E94]WBJ97977.1 hypothetical protein HWQ47_13205 [Shewanella sp. MTB7]
MNNYQSSIKACSFLCIFMYFMVPTASARTINVYLQGGQSNSDGRAVSGNLNSPYDVKQANYMIILRTERLSTPVVTTVRPSLSESGQSGPELSFSSNIAEKYAGNLVHPDEEIGDSIVILKYANGGTNLHTNWKANGTTSTTGDGRDYLRFQQTVAWGLDYLAETYPNSDINVAGMYWMQGESDAFAGQSSGQYQSNLTTLIQDVRANYGKNLPFAVGLLSTQQIAIGTTERNNIVLAQQNVADNLFGVGTVNTDTFGIKGDNLHFNATGQISLGSAFADSLDNLNSTYFVNLYPFNSVRHYSFDGSLEDSGVQKNHGTGSPVGYSTTDKAFGSAAVQLAGTPIQIPSIQYENGSPYSVSFWLKREDKDRIWDLVVGSALDRNNFIGIKANETVRWRGINATAPNQADFMNAVGNDTKWHHYVIVASKVGENTNEITLYVDGLFQGKASNKNTRFIIDSIGKAYTGNNYLVNGLLDEVWIIDDAITPAQVASLFLLNELPNQCY